MVKLGEKAPDFSGIAAYQKSAGFKKISLSDYRGQWLILFFYPRDFTFVCPTEIREFSRLSNQFKDCRCSILACSTDSEWSHKSWFEHDLEEVEYPVLADTSHRVSESYEILGLDGAAQRGTFIIDPEGVMRWFMVSDSSVGRSVKETFRALQALQTGELCPAEWHPGEKTLGKGSES